LIDTYISTAKHMIIVYDVFFIAFFFSSRRRHTRSKRDWSSDVCSSDLCSRGLERELVSPKPWFPPNQAGMQPAARCPLPPKAVRSEERRVGKECRSWWAREHVKKKKMR